MNVAPSATVPTSQTAPTQPAFLPPPPQPPPQPRYHALAAHVQQAALLSSECHDVALAAFGRIYRLHRIFLVQAAFFSSLLRGGFSEGTNYRPPGIGPRSNSSSSDQQGSSTFRLTFDDPNITRPAFEHCIAHLYASAPQLVLPQWAIPSTAQPLSSHWPPATSSSSSYPASHSRPTPTSAASVSGDYQPATPRFLVSLLATSIYLGIPSLSTSSLTLILASFTPFTVSTYLRFALGKPIIGAFESRERANSNEAIWDWELEGPCWGLEGVGTLEHTRAEAASSEEILATSAHTSAALERSNTNRTTASNYHSDYEDAPSEGEADEKPTRSSSIRIAEDRRGGGVRTRSRSSLHKDIYNGEDDRRSTSGDRIYSYKHQPAATSNVVGGGLARAFASSSTHETSFRLTTMATSEVTLDYGPLARRIAESCFCYFARWGRDIALAEETKWLNDQTALHALLDSMDRGQDASHGQALVCEAVAPFLLPRGYLPARLPDGGLFAIPGTLRVGEKKVPLEAFIKWDLPTPALNVFSHPILSHSLVSISSLGLPSTPGLTEELMFFIDPMASSSLGLASSHIVDLLGSDAFFVRNELQRYDVAKRIVTLRRNQKALFEEVHEALGLLDEGIEYAHTEGSQSSNNPIPESMTSIKVEPIDGPTFGSSPSTHDDSVASRVRNRDRSGSNSAPWTPPRLQSSGPVPTLIAIPSPRDLPFNRLNLQGRLDDNSMDLDDSNVGSGIPKNWHAAGGRDGDEFEIMEEDDAHYARLFAHGIYYSHLDFADLKRLSEEAAMLADAGRESDEGESDGEGDSRKGASRRSGISPRRHSTTQIFAPVEVLQAALWAGHDLKARIMGTGNTSLEDGGVENIKRGLAFVGDGNADGLPASWSSAMEANASVRSAEGTATSAGHPDRDESLLGISSSLKQFAQAFRQSLTTSSRRSATNRANRSARGDTPGTSTPLMSPARGTNSQSGSDGAALTLGGLSYSPLTPGGAKMGGVSPAAKTLLSKRYFSIPVDDTVRYGEYFTGLLGGTSSNTQGTTGDSSTLTDAACENDATGLAAMKEPWSLPTTIPAQTSRSAIKKLLPCLADSPLLSNVDRHLVGGPLSDIKRLTDNLFGLKNKASTGKILGKVGVEVARRKAGLDGDTNVGGYSASPSSSSVLQKSRYASAGGGGAGAAAATGSRTNPIDLRSHANSTPDNSILEREDDEGTGGSLSMGLAATSAVPTVSDDDKDYDSGLQLAKLEARTWTGFEPMRIGVEYFGLDLLEEKHRLYSPSFFYAGSVWNLYVQTIRKPKGTQLGIYLHRQSPLEPLPPSTASVESVASYYHGGHSTAAATAPREAGAILFDEQHSQGTVIGSRIRGQHHPQQQQQQQQHGNGYPHPPARLDSLPMNNNHAGLTNNNPTEATTNGGGVAGAASSTANAAVPPTGSNQTSLPSTITGTGTGPTHATFPPSQAPPNNTGPPVLPGISPAVPYRDPRRLVRAFFSIHCHSPLGSALTRFDSGPDRFSESQSWGWKSSSLMGVWELPNGLLPSGRNETADGFRCVVTMGVI